MKDPYETLGLSKSSSDDEIKKAYRTLAKKYHPDLNPNNKEAVLKFKEINIAYKLIENKEARDKFEKNGFDEQSSESSYRERPYYNESKQSGGRYTYNFDGNPDDIFESFFSGMNKESDNHNGQDHLYSMEIDLKDSITGSEKEIELSGGKKLKVKIPALIINKTKLRFKNQGGPGIGNGKPGDAFVEILIKHSNIFKINGNNIEVELPLNLDEAVNGAKIKVPTIEGAIMLSIPPGVNSGSKLRIKENGIPAGNDKKRGDQIVTIKIVLPEKSDAEFKDFIKKWSGNNSYNPRVSV